MAVDSTFRAIISVVDQTAAPLRAINDRLEAMPRPIRQISESFDGVGEQLTRLANHSGLSRLGASVGTLGSRFGWLAGKISGLVGPQLLTLGGLAAGAATTGLVALAVQTASAGDDLGDLSSRTGIATETLQEWQDAAMRAGVSGEGLTSALQKLTRNMGDAAVGKNKDVAELFQRLGLSLRGANGQIRPVSEVLPLLADGFSKTADQALRVRAAVALFGKAGEQMLPMIVSGGDDLREASERFRQFGFIISDEMSSAFSAADSSFKNLTTSVQGLGSAIGLELAPILGPIAEEMAVWVRANRDWIATNIGGAVASLAGWLRKTNEEIGPEGWQAFRDGVSNAAVAIGDFLKSVPAAVKAVGGLQNVLIGFGVIAALPFIAALAQIGVSLGAVALGAGRTLAALRAVSAAGPAAGAASAVTASGAVAAGGMSVASRFGPAVAAAAPAASGMGQAALAVASRFAAATGSVGLLGPLGAALTLQEGLGALGEQRDQTGDRTREQIGNFRRRGSLGGFYAGPASDNADSGFRLPDTQSLLTPRGGSGAPSGQVEMRVRFENAPAGMSIDTNTRGSGLSEPVVEIGRSMQGYGQ